MSASRRRIDDVDWRLAVYLLAIPIILLYCLSITGCVSDSPGLNNIYLLQLKFGEKSETRVRVGYFGICLGSSDTFTCSPTAGMSQDRVIDRLKSVVQSTQDTPVGGNLETLLSLALTLQSKLLLCHLAVGGALFLTSLLPLVLLKRGLKKNGNFRASSRRARARQAAIALTWASAAMAIAASVGSAQATSALQYITTGEWFNGLQINVGTTLQALQWAVVGMSLLYGLGISSIFRVKDGTIKSAGGDFNPKMALNGPTPPLSPGLPPGLS